MTGSLRAILAPSVSRILFDLAAEKGYDLRQKHLDCGMLIFDSETQDTHAGGSGCGCAAVTLASYLLPKD